MALSDKALRALETALASSSIEPSSASAEIKTALEAASAQADLVTALGSTTDIGTTDGSGGAGDAALAADTEARLDAIEAKVDEVIAALKSAGLMASS